MTLDDDGVTLTYTAVIPTRNRAGHLPGALATLLAQTRRPARIVVVDASDEPLAPGETLTRAVAGASVELLVVLVGYWVRSRDQWRRKFRQFMSDGQSYTKQQRSNLA